MIHSSSNAIDTDDLYCIMDNIPVAVTVADLEGMIMYFNDYAQQILDRKPEYIGTDIRLYHRESGSIVKIDRLIDDFKNRNRNWSSYEANRYGKHILVMFTPLEKDNRVIGIIQSVIIIGDLKPDE